MSHISPTVKQSGSLANPSLIITWAAVISSDTFCH